MKKIKIITLLIIAAIGFNSCENDDTIEFVAQAPQELAFSNSFSDEYIITIATLGNLGERFTWNSADFDVPTIVNYHLEKSNTGDFTDLEFVGSTTGNELSITIGDMFGYASQLGLDNDPDTEAPDTGDVSFRIRAFVGISGPETFSAAQVLTLVLPEETGGDTAVCDFDQLFGVGAGLTFAGWSWDTPAEFVCSGTGVYSANVNLQNLGGAEPNNNFRFFTTATDWGSGQNYPFFADAGYSIDTLFENAMDDDNNFGFVGTSGLYYLEIDTVSKTITLSDPTPTGDCDLDQLWGVGAGLTDAGWSWDTPIQFMCDGLGVYSGYVNLQNLGGAEPNNNFRFFTTATDWGSGQNYPFFADAGYTIDALFENAMDDDQNFGFIGTTGAYFLTIDTINKTITLE